jgi:hypothetical protein
MKEEKEADRDDRQEEVSNGKEKHSQSKGERERRREPSDLIFSPTLAALFLMTLSVVAVVRASARASFSRSSTLSPTPSLATRIALLSEE